MNLPVKILRYLAEDKVEINRTNSYLKLNFVT